MKNAIKTPMEPTASSPMRRCPFHPPSPTTRSRLIHPPGSRPLPFPLSTLPHFDWDLQHRILRPTF
ncbi:hypothetical protein TIFTF001_053368 [Ficus carica]|uniref:Uncharacterized protein n=1 Tax=Ficus carica TaxID=3494 RepID=A0AA88EB29_FICCA|nr:hypothetical protein TIFTF001_053368 [Ficus carica]